jgi:galactokinase
LAGIWHFPALPASELLSFFVCLSLESRLGQGGNSQRPTQYWLVPHAYPLHLLPENKQEVPWNMEPASDFSLYQALDSCMEVISLGVHSPLTPAGVKEMDRARELRNKFRARFGGSGSAVRAPGRVNLIGEHTDYNEGFVLPAAIDFSCWVVIATRNDRKIELYSENFDEAVEATLDDLRIRATEKWANYALGTAWSLEQAGYLLAGANLYIAGDVPLGAGLSSSAAVEVSTGYALLTAARIPIEPTRLALLCQKAENEFVGARCGIMDQYVSCHGRAGNALLLDCRSLEFRLVKLPVELDLVICNTMVRHELGMGQYNVRRAECETAVQKLSRVLPGIRSLRDVSLVDLDNHRELLGETIYKRGRHVVSENARVVRAAAALETAQLESLRQVMADSHRSLREDYEVSCPELDIMVQLAEEEPGVFGARMTGGGFGGCTINLVSTSESGEFRRRISEKYEAATGLRPDVYICKASPGAELLDSVDAL